MALRSPLVVVNGQVEQLQSGDTLNASCSQPAAVTQTNGEGSATLTIGMPVYNSSADTVKRAEANASSTVYVLGLVQATSITNGSTGAIQTDGVLSATTGQWGAIITGTPAGLTTGSTYYVDPATPGFITPTAPTTVGQYVVPVGLALSTTEMHINVGTVVLL
jgi:hypothetical protein